MIKKFEEFIKLNESKFNNVWKKILNSFLEEKSIKFGNKTKTVNYFFDISGGTDISSVYKYLKESIELCKKYKYDKIKLYGFCGGELSKPFIINNLLELEDEQYLLEEISDAYNFIMKQEIGIETSDYFDIVFEQIIDIIKQDAKENINIILVQDRVLFKNKSNHFNVDKKYTKDICITVFYNSYGSRQSSEEIGEKTNKIVKKIGFDNVICYTDWRER
jgi:hypothetical protein